MSRHIVIVEDEPHIRANYADALRRHGYRVSGYGDRRRALEGLGPALPDLVLLDIGLGDEIDGGFELCRTLRARSPALPIIFLTARDGDFDAVSGLRLGADDYLTKEVSIPHLIARIAALFRRADLAAEPAVESRRLDQGRLAIDLDRLRVAWDGAAVDLTLTELWIVHALARHPGHVRSRDQLMDEASIVVDSATISTHIKRIRRKFAAVDPAFDAIEAVYGIGYRWREPV